MTNSKDTASFFEQGTNDQFEFCYKLYPEALKLKAEKRCKKPQELIRLDQWYQNELPKLIKGRGKDKHMVYDELVQSMKWKQSRGKFYPQLSYLVKVNTPRAVMQETKKAFKKLPNLEQAITALSNLKGVGTTMASALLAAAAPESAPFMADECLMAIPEIEGIDYTTKEYLNFVQHIQATVDRLNAQSVAGGGGGQHWSPHRVELALWAHYVANDLNPELLDNMPAANSKASAANGNAVKTIVSVGINDENSAGKLDVAVEDTNDGEDTNESLAAAQGGETNNTATESETDNENTNPIPTKMINNISSGVLQDGDSNFISNDSTSQEEIRNTNIIDEENTTQTTATTSTDDGEVGSTNTPLASDSESNIELPSTRANNNNIAATAAATDTATAATSTNDVNVSSSVIINKDNIATEEEEADAASLTTLHNSSNGIKTTTTESTNGNGSLMVGSESNNSNSLLRSTANDEASVEFDDDDDDVDDESNSNSVSGGCKTLAAEPTTTAAQKRSLIQSSNDDEPQPPIQPDVKKARSD